MMNKSSTRPSTTESGYMANGPIIAENFLVSQPWRALLLGAGCLAVTLGVLGIFLPLLPTVPFLLLAAVCFSRSSRKLQLWLFNHRYLGPYLTNYLLRKGISKKQLLSSLSSMWLAMLLAIYFAPIWSVKIFLLVTACLVSRHLLSLQRLP
ncbi:YbaN family protein [Moritella yayanosii]|uniref:Inner membrane protein n=1 Tax=Moritella yayanosii TaxID=69539 RepID=A0A330LV91_9GAMM|nr:YbaN family protein [Moritella yayanosii]SQD79941.1 Inner membrane protein [Moritella yayanosii]